MTLLFYLTKNNNGGGERIMTYLANYFANLSYRVIFVTGYTTKTDYNLDKKIIHINLNGVNSNTSISMVFGVLKRIFPLRHIIIREKPDLIISFLFRSLFVAVFSLLFLRIPLLTSIRNDPNYEYKNPIMRYIVKFLYSQSTTIVCQNSHQLEWLSVKLRKRSVIIPNPIDDKFYKIDNSMTKKNIIGIGRLEKQKNWQMAIKAFGKISDSISDDLLIYGSGSMKEELVQLCCDLNLINRVFFMGYTSKTHEKLAESKLFIMTSEYEGMPNALLEAQAVGLPCIITSFTGGSAYEIVENNVNGIIVDSADIQKLSVEMYKLLTDDDLRIRLGCNARIVAEQYKAEKIFLEWQTLLETKLISNIQRPPEDIK